MYPNLEIDHIYKIVENEEDAVRSLNSLGDFTLTGTDHENQGTSARFVMFRQNYLEHIYLRDRKESLNNHIKFHERVDEWKNGSGSRYGFGFRGVLSEEFCQRSFVRGVLSEEEKKDFVLYEPKYVIYKHKSYFENKHTPSIFVMSFPSKKIEDYYPINYKNYSPDKINDDEKLNSFKSVVFKTPYFAPIKVGNLEIISSKEESVIINESFSF